MKKKKKALVIVESPAKVKTIGKFLKKGFTVCSSMGHLIDLPKSRLGVDITHDFKPDYIIVANRRKLFNELKEKMEDKDELYLATDPDREGEAIGWHLAQRIGEGKEIRRASFNEITREAVVEAFAHPTSIDLNKVNAQQARRILDRVAGYKLSPLLWKKVRRGLSAGRVQSVALRLIVERDDEIKKFISQEYWTIQAELKKKKSGAPSFLAGLEKIAGKKPKIRREGEARDLIGKIKKEEFLITAIKEKEKKKNPLPPFTTSTLQQTSFNRLRFAASKTMLVAQRLYEGIELGEEGAVGLITYMRTDSVRISEGAISSLRSYIRKNYEKKYLSPSVRRFRSKKSAQAAHEAIRPTSIYRTPESIKQYLTPEEHKLYRLIWRRALKSQMAVQRLLLTSAEVTAGDFLFIARGQRLLFPGFTIVEDEDSTKENILPDLQIGDRLHLIRLTPEQHFTQALPHYSDATLVKALEDKGVGRPSTYVPILRTIIRRDYVVREERKLVATELGRVVTELLIKHFPVLLDEEFTARLEGELDEVEEGKIEWRQVLRDFWGPFEKDLVRAKEFMRDVKKEEEKITKILCAQCGEKMRIKFGRGGKFLACSGFPRCRNTKSFRENESGEIEALEEEKIRERCPQCGKELVIKWGRLGKFLACSGFPDCKFTRSPSSGILCPQTGCSGELVRRRTRKGRFFYGCSRYPECKYSTWSLPKR